MVQMSTWRRGRQLVAARIKRGERPINEVLDGHTDIKKVNGTGVFLFKDLGMAPPALINNLHHNKVLHKTTLIVSVETADEPRIDPADRAEVTKVEPGVFQVLLTFGFMEDPDSPGARMSCKRFGESFDLMETTFYLSRETIVPTLTRNMTCLRARLFALMSKNATSATEFFKIPTGRVVELGTQLEI